MDPLKVPGIVFGDVPKAAVQIAKVISPEGDYEPADAVVNGCAQGVGAGAAIGAGIGGVCGGPPGALAGAAIGGALGGGFGAAKGGLDYASERDKKAKK